VIDRGRRHGKKTSRFPHSGLGVDGFAETIQRVARRTHRLRRDGAAQRSGDRQETTRDSAASTLWIRGGFPESYLASNDPDSLEWRKDFIRTYLERDVPLLGPRIPAETLERLWTMLAHEQAALLNASRLATALMISAQTVTRYIDLLVDLLLVRRLRPFHINAGKRLVKSPKVFVRDSGIVHGLLGIADYNALSGHPVRRRQLGRLRHREPYRRRPCPHDTQLLSHRGGRGDRPRSGDSGSRPLGLEIKRSQSAKPEKGFYLAMRGPEAETPIPRQFRQ
jgi:uncharacterized protein